MGTGRGLRWVVCAFWQSAYGAAKYSILKLFLCARCCTLKDWLALRRLWVSDLSPLCSTVEGLISESSAHNVDFLQLP
ncbi:hypothetical protein B0T21DRAFT_364492 [Apiosordaria backusii]|uniref:Uncharacterized protein n=1 Tax=Apiosordaria backusii TaxID=314023 RepID=A0AA40EGQ4_9PEZI|nr:hypothetical protein B0T21DRAFT_364492 [Apiosordaria backusii]